MRLPWTRPSKASPDTIGILPDLAVRLGSETRGVGQIGKCLN